MTSLFRTNRGSFCPPYQARLWNGELRIIWNDESDQEWSERMETHDHQRENSPAAMPRREVRDGSAIG